MKVSQLLYLLKNAEPDAEVKLEIWTEHGFYDSPSKKVQGELREVTTHSPSHPQRLEVVLSGDAR